MTRVIATIAAFAMAATAFLVGATVGTGEAQPEVWSRPGDAVDDVPDADAALAWWQGLFGAASREPADLAEANDLLWIALGKMADDLMELDIKTRPLTKPVPRLPVMQVFAYVDADQPTNPQYEPARQANAFGGRAFVIHLRDGDYRVVVPNAGSADGSRHGMVNVSTIDPVGALCRTVDWGGETDFLTIDIECRGLRRGVRANREFVMTFSR